MATPIGHALAGYAVYRVRGRRNDHTGGWFLLCILLAMAPDLDFLPGLLVGLPVLYHQGISHSLAFALAVSCIVTMLCRSWLQGHFLGNWMTLFAAYTSHLLIDLLGPDRRPPFGIPLFWPVLDEHYLSSFQLLLGASHAKSTLTGTSGWLAGILQFRNVVAILTEIAVIAPVVLLVQFLTRRRSRPAQAETTLGS